MFFSGKVDMWTTSVKKHAFRVKTADYIYKFKGYCMIIRFQFGYNELNHIESNQFFGN